ncbi:hypothetical protein PO124_02700 [Bacillus licheniformis]|nr:hypothetical protein [Bacillus licheniformis]
MASDIQIVASHPAPAHLAKLFSSQVQFVTSNAQAALACASNAADGCITTIKAADEHRLKVIKDLGKYRCALQSTGLNQSKEEADDDFDRGHCKHGQRADCTEHT